MTPELMTLLVQEYPDGYEYDTVYFTNAKGEKVEAVELITEDTKYLIKVSSSLTKQFENFDLDDDDSNESDSSDTDFDGFESVDD